MTLPGMEYPRPEAGATCAAYATALDALRESGHLQPWHEGLAANLLRLAAVIDAPGAKAYAVANASAQAHAIMCTLLELVPTEERDEDWESLVSRIQSPT